MSLVIDTTTRYFTVVGAPYLPEHHYDVGSDLEPYALLHPVNHTTIPPTNLSGWLRDDH